MKIEYLVNGKLDAGEIIEVFQSVGWNKDEKNIVGAFEKSFYDIIILETKTVRMIRLEKC
jgi:hypothetical protein